MQVTEIHTEDNPQIGGGAGWVAEQVRAGLADAKTALDHARSDWASKPVVGPHPREAALAAAREAVLHLNEALSVEAPDEAVAETRHALEALNSTIGALEKLGNQAPAAPGVDVPVVGGFERAITALVRAEARLRLGDTYGEPGHNPGIVPPWLR